MEARFFLFFALFQLIHPSISRYLLGVLYSLSLCYFGLIYNGKEIKHEIRPKNKEEREQEPDRELGEWSEQKSKGKRKACILFVSLPFLLPLVFCFISFSYRIILLFPLCFLFLSLQLQMKSVNWSEMKEERTNEQPPLESRDTNSQQSI